MAKIKILCFFLTTFLFTCGFIVSFLRCISLKTYSLKLPDSSFSGNTPTSTSLIQALQAMQPPQQTDPNEVFQTSAPVQPKIPIQAVPAATVQQIEANFCTGKTDGIHPHPVDCSKYIDCVQGREYPGTCPSGTAFDSTYGVCDYTHKISRCAIQGFQ